MFGNPVPPRPSRNQPFVVLGIGVLIATVLTLIVTGVMRLAERLDQAGQDDGFGLTSTSDVYVSTMDLSGPAGSTPAAPWRGDPA